MCMCVRVRVYDCVYVCMCVSMYECMYIILCVYNHIHKYTKAILTWFNTYLRIGFSGT